MKKFPRQHVIERVATLMRDLSDENLATAEGGIAIAPKYGAPHHDDELRPSNDVERMRSGLSPVARATRPGPLLRPPETPEA